MYIFSYNEGLIATYASRTNPNMFMFGSTKNLASTVNVCPITAHYVHELVFV